MKELRFAVLGAGAGGQTMAAFLAEKGYPVRLYDHNLTRIQQLQTLRTIRVTGKWTCQGTPEQITASLPQALEGADIILVVTTTCGTDKSSCSTPGTSAARWRSGIFFRRSLPVPPA